MLWTRTASQVCRQLKAILWVADAWIEWQLDDDRWIETVAVVAEYDTDPARRNFSAEFLEQVRATVRAVEPALHRRIRVIPRGSAGG